MEVQIVNGPLKNVRALKKQNPPSNFTHKIAGKNAACFPCWASLNTRRSTAMTPTTWCLKTEAPNLEIYPAALPEFHTWQDFHFGASSHSRKPSQIFPHLRSGLKDLVRHSSTQRTTPPKALIAHQVMPHIPPSLWVWVWAVVFVQEAPGLSNDQGRLPWEARLLAASCANEAAKAAMFRAMFTAVVRASWKPDLTYTSNICDKSNFKRHFFFKFQLWRAPTSHNHPKHDVRPCDKCDKHTQAHVRTLQNTPQRQLSRVKSHNVFFEMIHHLDPFGAFPIPSSMYLPIIEVVFENLFVFYIQFSNLGTPGMTHKFQLMFHKPDMSCNFGSIPLLIHHLKCRHSSPTPMQTTRSRRAWAWGLHSSVHQTLSSRHAVEEELLPWQTWWNTVDGRKSQTTTVWMYIKHCKWWDHLSTTVTGAGFIPSTVSTFKTSWMKYQPSKMLTKLLRKPHNRLTLLNRK